MTPASIFLARAIADTLSYKTIIAISTAGGGVILMIIILLLVLLYHAVSKHRRLVADLEQHGIDFCRLNMSEAHIDPSRPSSVLRRGSFIPFGVSAGWSTLDSQESISAEPPDHLLQANDTESQKRQTSSGTIPWSFCRLKKVENNVPLSEISALNLPVITESSQASDFSSACTLAAKSHLREQKATSPQNQNGSNARNHIHKPVSEFEGTFCSQPSDQEIAVASSDSLTPKPLFSSSDVRERTIEVSKRRNRSKTVGAIRLVSPDYINSRWHVRSLSLGSQHPGSAPNGPVPPLPLNFALNGDGSSSRTRVQDWASSRLSGSSLESVGSSLLITSPKIKRSYSARYKEGPNRDWSNSLVAGPRPLPRHTSLRKPIVVLGSTQEFGKCKGADCSSAASEGQFDLSEKKTDDAIHQASNNGSSFQHLNATERARLNSRVSTGSQRTGQILRTPRRPSRLSVTPNGSPNRRSRALGHHDVSSVQSTPSRQASQTSTRASSTRSSNGNPFQWDPSPMQSWKPSALKGSPSSRKGHRRQNCVRISLSPTIISTHRPSSNPSMVSIQEESPEPGSQVGKSPTGLGFSNSRSLPHPPSSSTFAPEVKFNPTTLRASLTPDSPTLSLVSYIQEPPPGELGGRNWPFTASPFKLHQSDSNSSMLAIPTFRSPGKAAIIPIIPTPTFSFSRPSSEFDEECDVPPEFRLLAQPVTPSCLSFPENGHPTSPVISSLPNENDFTISRLQTDQLEPSQETSNGAQNGQEPVNVDAFKLLPKRPLGGTGTRQNNTKCPVDSPPCSPKSQPNRNIITKHTDSEAEPSAKLVEVTQIIMHTKVMANTGTEAIETGKNAGQSPSLTLATKHTASPLCASLISHEVLSPQLRHSIAQLRRMNSDASQNSLGGRRYRKLGREVSTPTLDVDTVLAGGRCKWDNWISILGVASEEDVERVGDAGDLVELGEKKDEVYGKLQRRENLEELGMDTEMQKGGIDDSKIGIVGDQEMRCKASVREGVDQEDMGSQLPMANSSSNRGQAVYPMITQQPSDALEGPKEPDKGQETLVVKVQPPSSFGSPGSLYDENGFLRC